MAAITMRELQKMSARTIAALPRAVPIRSGTETVAILTPLKKASPELIAQVAAILAEAEAQRTDEERAAIAEIMREIGEE